MVTLMHPLLRNLCVMLVENVLVLSAIHHSSTNIFFHPISLDSEGLLLLDSRYAQMEQMLQGQQDT